MGLKPSALASHSTPLAKLGDNLQGGHGSREKLCVRRCHQSRAAPLLLTANSTLKDITAMSEAVPVLCFSHGVALDLVLDF